MHRHVLPLIALLATTAVHGQIAFGGHPYGTRPPEKTGLPAAQRVLMPTVDAEALMAEPRHRPVAGEQRHVEHHAQR